MGKNRLWLLVLTVLVSAILVAGCAPTNGGEKSTEQKSATSKEASSQEGEKIILVGAPLPLTGALAPNGKDQRNGMVFWQDQVNKMGGIKVNGENYKVKLVQYDYASDTNTAVKLTEKLITEDKVNFLFSAFGSAATMAMAPITEKYGVLHLAPNAASGDIFNKGYKFTFGTMGPSIGLAESWVDAMVNQTPKPETIAILARNDLYPSDVAKQVKAACERKGIKVIYYQEYPVGTNDFMSPLTQIKKLNPDLVLFTGYTNDHIVAVKQARQLKLKPKAFAATTQILAPEYLDAVKELTSGVTTLEPWSSGLPDTIRDDVFGNAREYAAAFKQKFGYEPSPGIASTSAIGVVLQKAIEQAQSLDPAKVREYVAKFDADTFYGHIKFDQRGQIAADQLVIQIEYPKPELVWPLKLRSKPLRYPLDW